MTYPNDYEPDYSGDMLPITESFDLDNDQAYESMLILTYCPGADDLGAAMLYEAENRDHAAAYELEASYWDNNVEH